MIASSRTVGSFRASYCIRTSQRVCSVKLLYHAEVSK